MIKNQIELAKLIKQTICGEEVVIGMGAGSVSFWVRELPELLK